jgi:hypothetical protein
MIVELGVRNFGPIKDLQVLSLEATADRTQEDYYVVEMAGKRILKMALLYGPNASGKTSFLRALEFLRKLVAEPANHKNETLDFIPFLFDADTPNQPSGLHIEFVAGGILHRYALEFTRRQIIAEKMTWHPKGREALFFQRETDRTNGLVSVEFGSTVEVGKRERDVLTGNTLENVTVLGAFGKTNAGIPDLQLIYEWFTKSLLPGIFPSDDLTLLANAWAQKPASDTNIFVDLINKADLQISNFKPSQFEGDPLHFVHTVKRPDGTEEKFVLDAPWESRGTMRIFGLAAFWSDVIANNQYICVDEFESSLHPELAEHLLLTFLASSEKGQLLMTTHDVLLLGNRDIIRHDTIWLTQKKQDGSTELYSVADFDTGTLRKKESLLNAYNLGKLGALPVTGSIFVYPEKALNEPG